MWLDSTARGEAAAGRRLTVGGSIVIPHLRRAVAALEEIEVKEAEKKI